MPRKEEATSFFKIRKKEAPTPYLRTFLRKHPKTSVWKT
jgi:hypothetical protein